MKKLLECQIQTLAVFELAEKLNISYDFAKFLKSEIKINNSILVCENCLLECPLGSKFQN
jgi:epoxyqueuosine reductase QueG